jgi:quinol monooxygenase YgiN
MVLLLSIEQGIIQLSKEEPGNYKYDYYIPLHSEDDLCLFEIWTDEQAQKKHGSSEQYQRLTRLKQAYVESVEIEKYWINKE